jgi:small subunit ribosomal protein S2
MRAIHLYCDLAAAAVLDGLQAELAATGEDLGAQAELPPEVVEAEIAAEAAATEAAAEASAGAAA